MKRYVLLTIIAEWLEEWEMPSLILRNQPIIEPANIKRILAIVGPRRAGKTYSCACVRFIEMNAVRVGIVKNRSNGRGTVHRHLYPGMMIPCGNLIHSHQEICILNVFF